MRRIVVKYLHPKDVLLLHHLVIEELGGVHGISDFKLFESAVMTPNATFVGQEMYPSMIEKAAALFHSLLTKPVFFNQKGNPDINQKTAILSTITFLELNGYQFLSVNEEILNFIKKVEKEKLTIDQTIDWLQKNFKQI